MPGFRTWFGKNVAGLLATLDDKRTAELGQALGAQPPSAEHVLAAVSEGPALLALDVDAPVAQLLQQGAAQYLGREQTHGRPADAVARFHLGNGARVEQINWAADPSPKGLRQSCGLMVNYLYDLKRLDKHRALVAKGRVPMSRAVETLLPKEK